MAQYRLTEAASDDLVAILRVSRERFGLAARDRYRDLLLAAFRTIASDPTGPLTRDRSDISPGVRSFHLRHGRQQGAGDQVLAPAHLVFFRPPSAGRVVILRVLHERMNPSEHVKP